MSAGIHFPYSDSQVAANNGITNNAGTLQLGGALIQNTSITGAYGLGLTDAGASFAVGAAADGLHRVYGLNTITAAVDGAAAGLFSTAFTPAANVAGTTNIYGAASILDLNLDNFSINTASSVNITGHLSQLVLRKSAAQSSGILLAHRAALVLHDDVNAAEVRMMGIKAPEVYGAGAAIATLTGLYIEAQKIAAVTTAYGIYQAGANDRNYLTGITTVANNLLLSGGLMGFNSDGSNTLFIGSINAGAGSKTRIVDNNSSVVIAEFNSGLIVCNKGIQPASIADASAPNNSIYYSTTASKLVYKDSGGVVNALY